MDEKGVSAKDRLATIGDVEAIMSRVVNDAVDSLAIAVKSGFDYIHAHMVTREEFNEFKGNIEPAVYNLQLDVSDIKVRLTRVEEDVSDLRDDFSSFRTAVTDTLRDHESRLSTLEDLDGF